MLTVAERVEKGIQLLDEKSPGWRESIDLHQLKMIQCDKCILGQMFINYGRGRTELNLTQAESVEHGFQSKDWGTPLLPSGSPAMVDYLELEAEWHRRLTENQP